MQSVPRSRAVAAALLVTLASCSSDNRAERTSATPTAAAPTTAAAATTTAAVATTTTAVATTTTAGATTTAAGATTTAAESTTTLERMVPMTDIASEGGVHFEIAGALDWLLVVGGVAWAMGDAPVTRIDASGNVLSTTKLPGPVCLAPDQGFGSVWAPTCGTPDLVRLDAATGAIQATISLPVADVHVEGSIGVSDDAVWAISADEQTLIKIDPISNSVSATYPTPQGAVAVRGGFGSLWITAPNQNTLYRVDPNDGHVVATIKVGRSPRFLTVGEHGVWTLNQGDGTVSHIDPATNTVQADITVDTGFIEGGDIASGGGAVWARVTTSLIVRIEPTTNAVTANYGPASGSGSVAADDSAIWVTAHDTNSVWRLPHA